jgi:predicted dehydrogenase
MLGVGVVGCGDIAQAMYIPGMKTLQDEGVLVLAAVCDQDTARLTATASRYPDVTPYDDLQTMVADPRVDIVVNLTPIQAHAACSLRALRAGKHVYSEKPIATQLEDADALIDAARQRQLKLVCAPVIILNSEVKRAIDWIKGGAIGKVASARARASHAGPARLYDFTTDPTWFYKPGGGPLFDLGVYPIQVLCAMLGPVRRVSAFAGISSPTLVVRSGSATGKQITVETPDNISMMLDFGDSTFATVDASYTVLSAKGPRMELYGDKGTLNLYSRPDEPEYELYVDDPSTGVRGWLQYEPSYRGSLMPHFGGTERPSWSFVEGVRHLVDCIVHDTDPLPSGELARHILEIMNAAVESSQSGRVVELMTSFEFSTQNGAN